MTPQDAVKRLLARTYEIDGEPGRASIIPSEHPDMLERVRKRLVNPIPPEVEGLFQLGAGVSIGFEELRWDGELSEQCFDDAFPAVWPVMADMYGNSWNIELEPTSGAWGRVYYFCHDPPVIAYQAASLADFIEQFSADNLPAQEDTARPLIQVHDELVHDVYRTGGNLQPAEALRESDDPLLKSVAAACAPGESICDLRSPKLGDGFRWSGRGTLSVRRPGPEPVFIITNKPRSKGLLARLRGRAS